MRNSYKVMEDISGVVSFNRSVYQLRRLPFIGRRIPDSVYKESDSKIILMRVIIGLTAIREFLGSFVYFALFIILPIRIKFFPSGFSELRTFGTTFVSMFFMLNVLGGGFVFHYFNTDSNEMTVTNLVYFRLSKREYFRYKWIKGIKRVAINTFIPLIVCALIFGQSVTGGIVLFVEMLGFRLFADVLTASKADIKKSAVRIVPGAICIIAGYLMLFAPDAFRDAVARFVISWPVYSVITMLGAAGVLAVKRFDDYDMLACKEIAHFYKTQEIKNIKRNAAVLKEDKLDMDVTKSVKGKGGYAYLNALFIKRHSRIFRKRALITAAAAFAVPVIVGAVSLIMGETKNIYGVMTSRLGVWFFIIYIIAFKDVYTMSLFNNIDRYLLMYSWYRKPEDILRNYMIRLRSSFVLNSMMTGPLAVGLIAGALLSGTGVLKVLPVIAVITVLTFCYSIHYLTLYYLLQPFTDEAKTKNVIYKISNVLIYIASYMMLGNDNLGGLVIAAICAVVTVYLIASLVLLRSKAPKTFKIMGNA